MQLALLADPIEERFIEFHHANPHVYRALVDMARKWKQSGNTTCSMKMLFEVLRWQAGISTQSADPFLLNNTYTSRYARLIAANERDLAGLFNMRQLKEGNE
jgi:hypothetical protein